MAPWESVPSAREVVAQLQDMLAAHGHRAAHWHGHSFGCVVIGWVMKMSPSSVVYATLMEPAQFLVIKAEALTKVLWGHAATSFEILIRYFAFRELFTVNLLCRNFFWEQSSMWPEDLQLVLCALDVQPDFCRGHLFAGAVPYPALSSNSNFLRRLGPNVV
ncbi:CYP704C1 [Symbiodinium necroappetens]|uniref:CYP704C1 protein n=1 Tax=Symbiodinium necroappetens TaxID=1628268 RepID=A0A813CEQ2_9DINO|nr:CYP704C1 [Symbiodinium necroappetens]